MKVALSLKNNNFDPTVLLLGLMGACGFFIGHPNLLQHMPLFVLLCPFTTFLLAHRAASFRQAFLFTMIPATIGISGVLYWVYIPITFIGGLPLFLAIPCVIALSMYLASYYGIASLFIFALCKKTLSQRSVVEGLLFAGASGLIYGSCEFLAGKILTGFPWLSLATSFAPWTLWIQVASLVGSSGETALLSINACLFASIFLQEQNNKKIIGICALLCIVSFPLYGLWRLDTEESKQQQEVSPPPVTIGLIQGNIDQTQKWNHQFQQTTVEKYISMSHQLIDSYKEKYPLEDIDLFLWPETAIPMYFDYRSIYAKMITNFARDTHSVLGFGTLGYETQAKSAPLYFNRFQTITREGIIANYYDKVHLVPFGEYLPLQLNFDFLTEILQGMGFSSGKEIHPIVIEAKDTPRSTLENNIAQTIPISLGVLICYESIFSELANEQVARGATLLVNISNDAWFGYSSAPLQHLSLAVMRAVEQQRFLARSTNTGYSALIDPYGKIISQGSLFTDEVLVVKATPISSFTFYHYTSIWINRFFFLVFIGMTIFCFFMIRRHKSNL